MDFVGRTEAGFNGTLNPGVGEGGVFSGEVDAAFGGDDVIVEQSLLSGVEEGESAPGEFVVVPHFGRADFEFFPGLGVDVEDVFQRLFNAIPFGLGPPALGVFGPGVAGEHHAPSGFAPVFGVEDVADGEIGDGSPAGDAFIFFPKSAAKLEKDFSGGVVVQLADGALFGEGEGFEYFYVAQDGEGDGEYRVVTGDMLVPGEGAVMDRDFGGGLIDSGHLCPKTDVLLQAGEKGQRELFRAAFELHEVGVETADFLPQKFQKGGVHHRFLVEEKSEHFDHAFGPVEDLFEVFTDGVAVVLGVNFFPGGFAFFCELLGERVQGLFP